MICAFVFAALFLQNRFSHHAALKKRILDSIEIYTDELNIIIKLVQVKVKGMQNQDLWQSEPQSSPQNKNGK